MDRKTIRRYQRFSNSSGVATGSESAAGQIPPPRPPAPEGATASAATRVTPSMCEPHRAWIEAQVGLGRNAVSIYQDLVEAHGFELPSGGKTAATDKQRRRSVPQVIDWMVAREASLRDAPRIDNSYTLP